MKRRVMMAAVAAGFVVGCVTDGGLEAPGPQGGGQGAGEPDLAEIRLVAAALRAEEALSGLRRALAADRPLAETAAPRLVPEALGRRVSLDWTGPLETLAERLADEAGYRFETSGAGPVRPLIVDIDVVARPLIAVMRDAGIQAGTAGLLVVDATRDVVRLDWAPPVPGAG